MSIEAMKQAIEALERLQETHARFYYTQRCKKGDEAITSLRVAIASYSQAIARVEGTLEAEPSRSDIKQKPVAWLWRYANGEEEVVFVPPHHIDATHVDAPSTITPLYLHPQPKREWDGLTDDEWLVICEKNNMLPDFDLKEEIEAKLKAKNERKEKNTQEHIKWSDYESDGRIIKNYPEKDNSKL